MRPGINLRRDGYEAAAERVKRRILHNRRRHVVAVHDCGAVRLHLAAQYEGPAGPVIGTYDGDSPVELIENDLIARMHEFTKDATP